MLAAIEWVCVIGALASVGAPLFYAVATLDGLQHKTVYPLFRFVEQKGHLSSTEASSA
jgi:hypothetical protein